MKTATRVAALIGGASVLTAMLGGCGMKAEVADDGKGKHMFCTDTRDGEKFSFKASTITNASVGMLGLDSCFDVTTDSGNARTLCKSHEAFIKCETKTPDV